MALFTQNWSSSLRDFLDSYYRLPVRTPMTCLEIGSFEGRGSLLIYDRLCKHPDSVLYCVDPWKDAYITEANVKKTPSIDGFFVGQFARFMNNTKNSTGIRPRQGYAKDVVPTMKDNSLDFAFIDGDHFSALNDFLLVFPKMKLGGVILFDDYKWEFDGDTPVKRDVDRLMVEYRACVSEIYRLDAVGIIKVKPMDTHIARIQFHNKSCCIDTYGNTDIISATLLSGHIWEPRVAHYLKRAFMANPDLCFVDIGANIGAHTCISAMSGCKQIYAVECNPATSEKLKNTIHMNEYEVKVFEIAASDGGNEQLEFNINYGNVGASCITRTHVGVSPEMRKIQVKCAALDSVIPVDSIGSALVKIDVEGHEIEALTGMKRLLAKTRLLIIELNPETSSKMRLKFLLDMLFERFTVCQVLFSICHVLFSIEHDAWSGPEIDEDIQFKKVTRNDIVKSLDAGYILEVVFSGSQ